MRTLNAFERRHGDGRCDAARDRFRPRARGVDEYPGAAFLAALAARIAHHDAIILEAGTLEAGRTRELRAELLGRAKHRMRERAVVGLAVLLPENRPDSRREASA